MTTKISGSNISSIANTGVTWNAVTVADGSTQLTASAGNGYFLDTNAGVIEVKLPASPTRGDTIILADYGNNFATNRVVIDTGGKLIDSTQGGVPDSDFILETNGQVVELIFADDTAGWIIKQNNAPSDLSADAYATYIEATGGTTTTSGNNKIHSFTGDGNFVVSSVGNAEGSNTVDYLVIAGGGSGGVDAGGGGGAGGYRFSNGTASGSFCAGPSPLGASALPVSATTYPITVGGGGAPTTSGGGNVGSNSVFSTITSTGGGGGATGSAAADTGGSGGGGKANNPCGAAGNTPPVSPPQGNPGGDGPGSGAGGGGAGAAGSNGSPAPGAGGAGGAGLTSVITGSPVARGGGGGGGNDYPSFPAPSGGSGGGGAGGVRPSTGIGGAGTANTGGGGGGSGVPSTDGSGGGGKGIVIIRYKFQG